MSNDLNRPSEFDAVLGANNADPVNAGVLGGIEGVQRCLLSQVIEHRISALSQALSYGEKGLTLVLQALNDSQIQVHKAAYELLKDKKELEIKTALDKYLKQRYFVRFDGLYHSTPIIYVENKPYNSTPISNNKVCKFLRFYQDGTVLYETIRFSEQNPTEIIVQWFNKVNYTEKKGFYTIESNNIKFSINSTSPRVDYWGEIEIYGNSIALQYYSNKHYYRKIINYEFLSAPNIECGG